jgi:hypothetical protein
MYADLEVRARLFNAVEFHHDYPEHGPIARANTSL